MPHSEWTVASPGISYDGSIDLFVLAEDLAKALPMELRLRVVQDGVVVTKSFPVESFRLVNHEQAGDEQPANRPMNGTEGGDNPQHEAEGTSSF